MAIKNTIPEVRFAGFSDDWIQAELKEIYNFQYGIFNNNPSNGGLYPVYGANGVIGGYTEYNSEDSVVIGHMGEYAGIVLWANGKHFVTYNGVITNPKNDSLFPKFGYYLLSKIDLRRICDGSGQPFLSYSILNKIKSAYPKIKDEQIAISTFLENIDKLIAEHQQKQTKLKSLKQAMLDKMFPKKGQVVPEIRFRGFSDNWDNPLLGDIGNPYTGLSGKTKNDFGHGEGRYITYMNVFSNPISDNNKVDKIEIDSSQNEVIAGDVLFTVSSETSAEVGMSSVWIGNQKNIYLNSFCFGYRPKIKLDNYFLANILRSKTFREQMILLAQGISRYNISKNKVMNLTISIPQFNEQVVIGEYFKNLDSLISQHNKQIIKLSNLKQTFLAKMFV